MTIHYTPAERDVVGRRTYAAFHVNDASVSWERLSPDRKWFYINAGMVAIAAGRIIDGHHRDAELFKATAEQALNEPAIYDLVYPEADRPPAKIETTGKVHDVRKYGAIGDGVADDTSALQAAITAAAGKVNDVDTDPETEGELF